MNKPKAYIASPFGFSESTISYMFDTYIPSLQQIVEVLNPWEFLKNSKSVGKNNTKENIVSRIGLKNQNLIDKSDWVIAALDGQEVDSGTAAEIGYAYAKGKRVYGIRSDDRKTGEEGAIINLQVQFFIEASGGKIFPSLKELVNSVQ